MPPDIEKTGSQDYKIPYAFPKLLSEPEEKAYLILKSWCEINDMLSAPQKSASGAREKPWDHFEMPSEAIEMLNAYSNIFPNVTTSFLSLMRFSSGDHKIISEQAGMISEPHDLTSELPKMTLDHSNIILEQLKIIFDYSEIASEQDRIFIWSSRAHFGRFRVHIWVSWLHIRASRLHLRASQLHSRTFRLHIWKNSFLAIFFM